MCFKLKLQYSILVSFLIIRVRSDTSSAPLNKALRWSREAPVPNSGRPSNTLVNSNFIRNSHQDGYKGTPMPNYQQVEIQPSYVVTPTDVYSDNKNQGYPNSNIVPIPSTFNNYGSPQSIGNYRSPQQSIGNFASPESIGNYGSPQSIGSYGAPQLMGNYAPPVSNYQVAPTAPSSGNKYISFGNNLPMEYSGSLASSYGGGGTGMKDWDQSSGDRRHGWGWMSEKPVNFSAVGLLGLLALMGMIQHVMADMDSSTMKPKTDGNPESGNSMGGGGSKPKPKPTKKPAKTRSRSTTRGSRIKRNSDGDRALPQFIINRLANAILPSYYAIAEEFGEPMDLECSRFHCWRILSILTQEFQVPKMLAVSSLSQSLKVMSKTLKASGEGKRFWETWKSMKPKVDFKCF